MATIISGSPSGWSRIALGQRFVFDELLPQLPAELKGWRPTARSNHCFMIASFRERLGHGRRYSISVSRRERKALRLRHGSDSGLTAEMFRVWFSGLSMLKLILFQPKPTTTHYYSTLKIQKWQYRKRNRLRNLPTHYTIVWTIVTKCVVMQQISYYMAPRGHMPNTSTVVT